MQLICPSIDEHGSGSLFDPTLLFLPRVGKTALSSIFGAVYLYAIVDSQYLVGMLIGRLLRQPASHWPPLFGRRGWQPRDFWSVPWHQSFRHLVVVFGVRPGGNLLGRPGAIMRAFAVSPSIHYLSLWGTGHGTDFHNDADFFLVGLGAVMEGAFQQTTGLRVGWLGWL